MISGYERILIRGEADGELHNGIQRLSASLGGQLHLCASCNQPHLASATTLKNNNNNKSWP